MADELNLEKTMELMAAAGISESDCRMAYSGHGLTLKLEHLRDFAQAARRAAPVAAQLDAELPPIEHDKDMDRTYIPLPGGWEIQTKGKGSTFRIAHAQSDSRWIVLGVELHEPLEAMARDTRNLMAQYAERIRLLEREKAELREASLMLSGEVSRLQGEALAKKDSAQSIDTLEFARVFGAVLHADRQRIKNGPVADPEWLIAYRALIAYIDGRTAGTAPKAPDPTEAAIKLRAKEIYAAFEFSDRYPWIDGRNSIRQDDARHQARAEFAAPSPQENTK